MKKSRFPMKSALLLLASVILLAASTAGSTRAALTYYSENYTAQMNLSKVGVTLLENGNEKEALLEDLLGEGEKLIPGKAYPEVLAVKNNGSIDSFVRVIITKSWQNANGKDTTLSPELIELNLLEGSGWVIAKDQCTDERIVAYYTNMVPAGGVTADLTDTIRIDNSIAEKVTKIVEGNTIRYVYDYAGYTFHVDAEVDSVQTHNAKEAIKSAWGVDVNVSADETSLSIE